MGQDARLVSCGSLLVNIPFRIGAGAGYSGDRIEPAVALAERGRLNALVFECLAERTIALAQLRRLQDPDHGHDPLLEARMHAVLPACHRQGVRIISNMGAANPMAAGRAVMRVAEQLGLPGLRVAVVEGDDVLPWVRAHDAPLLDAPWLAREAAGQGGEPATVRALDGRLVSANAYLGADALMPALQTDAHVVIAGRVADPALFLAPLMHHFAWAADDWRRLGRGVAVGHLLECAAQVTGGYIADPGVMDVPGIEDLGFPLAEVQADGNFVITKLAGSGGRVDRLTCTAQLLYEIEDPTRYLQPDVAANFAKVKLKEVGHDRVKVSGASGAARPQALKATLGYRDGFVGEAQIGYAGPGALARGRLARRILAHRLQAAGLSHLDHRLDLVGVDSMHGARRGQDREPYEVRVRLALRAPTQTQAQWAAREVEALYLNGPAAGGGVTASTREVVAAVSTLVPRDAVQPRCTLLAFDGQGRVTEAAT